jgi:cold shock CspA family protein
MMRWRSYKRGGPSFLTDINLRQLVHWYASGVETSRGRPAHAHASQAGAQAYVEDQTPPEIDFQGMEPSEAVRDEVNRHINLFERRFGRITACQLTVKGPGSHYQTSGLYEISIRLAIPHRKDVSVAHTAQNDQRFADFRFALNDAFKRARRQLQDRVRRLQHLVKHHAPRSVGRVARIDASGEFGFIKTPDGREICFHRNSVLNNAFRRLKPATALSFAEEEGEKGLQASTVRLLGKHLVP